MAHTTYHVELKISNPKLGYGILRIRKTKNKVKSYVSLKEKVNIADWNFETNKLKLKKGNSNEVDRIENLILSTIARLKQEDQNTSEVKVITDKKQHSFMAFFTKDIAHLEKTNYSTFRQKTKVYNRIMDFLETKGKTDLLIGEISKVFVFEFERFLSLTIKQNTYKKYISTFRTAYNELRDSDEYEDLEMRDPFRAFENKTTDTQEKSLSIEQFNSLVKYSFDKRNPLYLTKAYFVFSVYAGGIRVSDLMTLRWNTFSNDGFSFYQFKTKHWHYVNISFLMTDILFDFMPEYEAKIKALNEKAYYYDEIKNTIIHFDNSEDFVIFYTQELIIRYTDKDGVCDMDKVKSDLVKFRDSLVEEPKTKPEEITYRLNFEDTPKSKSETKPSSEKSRSQEVIKEEMLEDRLDLINQYAKEYGNNFIFPLLKNNDFKKIDFNREQLNLGKTLTDKMSYASTLYNSDLKKLQKEVFENELDFPLTSHIARHTTTTILLQRKESLYTIQRILGHKSIKITEKYVSGFQHLNLIREASIS